MRRPTDALLHYQAVKDFWLLERTYKYVIARCRLTHAEFNARVGWRTFSPGLFIRDIHKFDTVCHFRCHLGVADLIREAEDVLSFSECEQITGIEDRRLHGQVKRHKVEAVTTKPYTFFRWFDVFKMLGVGYRSDLLETHPLRVWRNERRLTLWRAGQLFDVKRVQYAQAEAGSLLPCAASRLIDVVGEEQFIEMAVWQERWDAPHV